MDWALYNFFYLNSFNFDLKISRKVKNDSFCTEKNQKLNPTLDGFLHWFIGEHHKVLSMRRTIFLLAYLLFQGLLKF